MIWLMMLCHLCSEVHLIAMITEGMYQYFSSRKTRDKEVLSFCLGELCDQGLMNGVRVLNFHNSRLTCIILINF